jgi:hypothetical protein
VAAWIAAQAGNFTVASGNAASPWHDGGAQEALNTVPGAGDTANPNGFGITIDGNVTCDGFVGNENVGHFHVTADRTVTLAVSGIVSNSTLAAGFIQVSGGTLTLVGGGAGKTLVAGSGAGGSCIVTSGTAGLTINNEGGTALRNTNWGEVVWHGATGTLAITGKCTSSSGQCLYVTGNATWSITNTGGTAIEQTAGDGPCVRCTSGTGTVNGNIVSSCTAAYIWRIGSNATLNGMFLSTAGCPTLYLNVGTLTWTGARTLAAGEYAFGYTGGGTLNITSLALTNSGTFVWQHRL